MAARKGEKKEGEGRTRDLCPVLNRGFFDIQIQEALTTVNSTTRAELRESQRSIIRRKKRKKKKRGGSLDASSFHLRQQELIPLRCSSTIIY